MEGWPRGLSSSYELTRRARRERGDAIGAWLGRVCRAIVRAPATRGCGRRDADPRGATRR